MKAYRIKDWDEHYEVAQTRKCKRLQWIAVTNSFDGVGYATVMSHPQFAEIFTAWILMLEIASKMDHRGYLVNGSPLTPKKMAIITRTKPEIFELALQVLSSPDVAWVEEFDW